MQNTVTLHYRGRKPYVHRQGRPLGDSIWHPGDTRVVSTRAAAQLLRFLEFERVPDRDNGQAAEQVRAVQQAESAREQVLRQQESTHTDIALSVQMMDKDALEQLARSYGADIDKRRSLENLRHQVLGIVEARQ